MTKYGSLLKSAFYVAIVKQEIHYNQELRSLAIPPKFSDYVDSICGHPQLAESLSVERDSIYQN